MRTWSNGTLCLPRLGSPLKIQIPTEWAHAAVVISVLDATEERIARGETIVQPPPRRVRKRTGAIRINAVALGKLLHVKLGHPLHRPADLIGQGAYPIFKTVVIAHLHMLAGLQRDAAFPKNVGIRRRPPASRHGSSAPSPPRASAPGERTQHLRAPTTGTTVKRGRPRPRLCSRVHVGPGVASVMRERQHMRVRVPRG